VPTRASAWIARLVLPSAARVRPGRGKVVARLGARAPWNGGPVGLLVLERRRDRRGAWLRVGLPRRPNGTSGWIPADVAKLTRTAYRVEISTARRTLVLLRAGKPVLRTRIVVGKPGTPTPHGLFAIAERVPQPFAGGFLGPWALVITAFSDTLRSFGGGPGQVAIHGRAGASLRDPLGSARSHGCVRIPNAAISILARRPEGTPVRIR
jgi:lipoprotein-anchoring transpeptidase ErfK/SrfK